MSSYVEKYEIKYDTNMGFCDVKSIYCKYEGVWNGQLWVNEDGTPVDFGCVTDSEAMVKSMCIAGIPTERKYEYWKEIKEFDIPEAVAKAYNYEYPQHIK